MIDLTLGFALDTGAPLRLPLSEVLRHTLVLGKSGSGKSFLSAAILCQLLAGNAPCCLTLIDCKGDNADLLRNLTLLLDGPTPIVPTDILSFSLSHGVCLPLDPLVPVAGMERAVQASIVVALLADLSGGFGPRMTSLATFLILAAMEAGASLLDVRAVLLDERLAPILATRTRDPELRHYLSDVFPGEPQASKDSLRSRLDTLLGIPSVRAMLCCGRSVPSSAFLESRLALIDLGGAGVGSRSVTTFIGSWIFALMSAAIYGRSGRTNPRHAYVVIDEWQRLAAFAAPELEDILATARSNRVSLTLCNQYAEQISSVSTSLLAGVTANVATEFLFRPGVDDLRHLERQLPVTGRLVDPARPDRLLTPAAERDLVIQQLANLRPREALFVNHLSGEPASVLRTPTLPPADAQAAWDALPNAEQTAWLMGRYGAPAEALTLRRTLVAGTAVIAPMRPDHVRTTEDDIDEPATPRARASRTRLRVLP